MLFTLLANSRAPAPRMMCEGKVAQYPAPELSPTDVVASQISALQAADSAPTQLNQRPAQVLSRVAYADATLKHAQTSAPSASRRRRESGPLEK